MCFNYIFIYLLIIICSVCLRNRPWFRQHHGHPLLTQREREKKTIRQNGREIKLCCVFCFENVIWLVYVIWMWIDWYRKYQPVEPEYEACCGVREANESQTSYSGKQGDIFQYQSYSHSDDMFIILKSSINTDTSIFVFLREKPHDSKYSKYASPKHSS